LNRGILFSYLKTTCFQQFAQLHLLLDQHQETWQFSELPGECPGKENAQKIIHLKATNVYPADAEITSLHKGQRS